MTRWLRSNAIAVAGAMLGVGVISWLGLTGFAFSDYDFEIAPAYKALTAGHVMAFLQLAPSYGGSLVLRAPFALLPSLWGGGELAVYRAVSIPCVLAAGVLGVYLVAQMRSLGIGTLARATVLGLCVANPLTLRALEIGHPEELLSGALCVAAVLAAMRGRAGWSGLFLGVAIANKPWALVAVVPVLMTLPAKRRQAAVIAAATTSVFIVPLLFVGVKTFVATNHTAASTGTIFQPWQAWWFTGSFGHVIRGGDGLVKVGYRYPPAWLHSLTHPLIIAISVPLSLIWLRLRRAGSRAPEDVLLLLALLFLARCFLDPWNNIYYSLPFLLALLSWEALGLRTAPLLTLASSAWLWIVFQKLPHAVSADVQSLSYMAWAIPMAAGLALRLYAPDRLAALRRGRQTAPLAVRAQV